MNANGSSSSGAGSDTNSVDRNNPDKIKNNNSGRRRKDALNVPMNDVNARKMAEDEDKR